MSTFEVFLSHLAEQGFSYDTGFLTRESAATAPENVIGFRFEAGPQQIDLYVRDEFWDASKSHPIFGESQFLPVLEGQPYIVRQILRA